MNGEFPVVEYRELHFSFNTNTYTEADNQRINGTSGTHYPFNAHPIPLYLGNTANVPLLAAVVYDESDVIENNTRLAVWISRTGNNTVTVPGSEVASLDPNILIPSADIDWCNFPSGNGTFAISIAYPKGNAIQYNEAHAALVNNQYAGISITNPTVLTVDVPDPANPPKNITLANRNADLTPFGYPAFGYNQIKHIVWEQGSPAVVRYTALDANNVQGSITTFAPHPGNTYTAPTIYVAEDGVPEIYMNHSGGGQIDFWYYLAAPNAWLGRFVTPGRFANAGLRTVARKMSFISTTQAPFPIRIASGQRYSTPPGGGGDEDRLAGSVMVTDASNDEQPDLMGESDLPIIASKTQLRLARTGTAACLDLRLSETHVQNGTPSGTRTIYAALFPDSVIRNPKLHEMRFSSRTFSTDSTRNTTVSLAVQVRAQNLNQISAAPTLWAEAIDTRTGAVYQITVPKVLTNSDTSAAFTLALPTVARGKRVRVQIRTAGILTGNALRLTATNEVGLLTPAAGRGSGTSAQASGTSSATEDATAKLPTEFGLSQNYPNPFNPSTTIKYQLPKASDVKIVLYDILGRSVATLVSERKAAGFYQVNFNASTLASGTYLYRIQAGEFVQTKKMVLVK
jgi:Secretion system C-terminal sorting domain